MNRNIRFVSVVVIFLFVVGCAWMRENLYPQLRPTCRFVCQVLGDNGCTDMTGTVVPGGEALRPLCELACDQIPEELGYEWKECVAKSDNCEQSDACMTAYGVMVAPYDE